MPKPIVNIAGPFPLCYLIAGKPAGADKGDEMPANYLRALGFPVVE